MRPLVPLIAVLAVAVPERALARQGVRPLFEPTDLELENPGVAEFDLQVGGVRGQGPWRAVLPDFELDFGLLRNLEFDLDGAYAIEGPDVGPFSFDHSAPDSLWASFKLGLYDYADFADDAGKEVASAWAIGFQAGPKLPVAMGSHGFGAEGLMLVGHATHGSHMVLNMGGFLDPSPDPASGRPIGLEVGLDLDRDLDRDGHFALTGEISAVSFISDDPNQFVVTAGIQYQPRDDLQLSIVGLWGFLNGGDRYGVLLGVSPKIHFFH
jgi:hypothetical protein